MEQRAGSSEVAALAQLGHLQLALPARVSQVRSPQPLRIFTRTGPSWRPNAPRRRFQSRRWAMNCTIWCSTSMSAPLSASSASAIVAVVIVISTGYRLVDRTSILSGFRMVTPCGMAATLRGRPIRSGWTYTLSWDISWDITRLDALAPASLPCEMAVPTLEQHSKCRVRCRKSAPTQRAGSTAPTMRNAEVTPRSRLAHSQTDPCQHGHRQAHALRLRQCRSDARSDGHPQPHCHHHQILGQ